MKHLDGIGERDHPYVLHGNINPLIDKVNEIIDKINEIGKRLDTPSDEEIEAHFTSSHYDNSNGHHYRTNKDRISGAKWAISEIIKRNK
jgi:hypothetical protein